LLILRTLENLGNARFKLLRIGGTGRPPANSAVPSPTDFNGDGHLDIAVANSGALPDDKGTVSITGTILSGR
jgi:hypothetical protein